MIAGVLVTLGNPKAVVFFGAVLPHAFDLTNLSLPESRPYPCSRFGDRLRDPRLLPPVRGLGSPLYPLSPVHAVRKLLGG
jgi:hypothetical protein